jgi:hypothetical protein
MSSQIIIRDLSSVWWQYPFLIVVASYCIFFFILVLRAFKQKTLVGDVKDLMIEKEQEREIKVGLIFSLILRSVMLCVGLFCLYLVYQDSFNGFTSVEVYGDRIVLKYPWPIPSKEVAITNVAKVYSEKWGKKSKIVKIVTISGKHLKSVSGDTEEMGAVCTELIEQIGK